MTLVYVPAALRELTGGARQVTASGGTVSAVIDDLDARYPGLKDRLVQNGALGPGLAALVDRDTQPVDLEAAVPEDATLYFVQAISGGV